jgi:hypothetical protein
VVPRRAVVSGVSGWTALAARVLVSRLRRVKQSAVGVHMVSCGSATSYTPIESNGPQPSKCV